MANIEKLKSWRDEWESHRNEIFSKLDHTELTYLKEKVSLLASFDLYENEGDIKTCLAEIATKELTDDGKKYFRSNFEVMVNEEWVTQIESNIEHTSESLYRREHLLNMIGVYFPDF